VPKIILKFVSTEKQGRRHDNGKQSVENRGFPFYIIYIYILIRGGVQWAGLKESENGAQKWGSEIRGSEIRNHTSGIKLWESESGNQKMEIREWESKMGIKGGNQRWESKGEIKE